MHAKKVARIRRASKARSRIKKIGIHRLCVHRTPRHIYCQVMESDGSQTLVSASTLEKGVSGYGGNIEAAKVIGKLIAERAKEKGIERVALDRAGFKYHGRIKALADAARENGLQF